MGSLFNKNLLFLLFIQICKFLVKQLYCYYKQQRLKKNLIYMSGFHLAKYLFFLSQQPFWSMPYHRIIVSWFDESLQKYYVNFFWKSWLLKRCIFIKNKDPIIHSIDNGPKGLQAIRKINILPNEIQTCKLGFISDVVVIFYTNNIHSSFCNVWCRSVYSISSGCGSGEWATKHISNGRRFSIRSPRKSIGVTNCPFTRDNI